MKKYIEQELNKILEYYEWKNIEEIDWDHIVVWEVLSKAFIKEFKDKLDLKYLLRTKKITQKEYNILTYGIISRFQLLDFT